MKLKNRCSGILLHISSLPSKDGIGCFNSEAFEFVDLLKRAKIKLWQILPLSKIGEGNSPYSSICTYAGNELFISIEKLIEMKLLDEEDFKDFKSLSSTKVDYKMVSDYKLPLLNRAADNFIEMNLTESKEYRSFLLENEFWLESYSLFTAVAESYNSVNFLEDWSDELAHKDEAALLKFKSNNSKRIEEIKIIQYFFYKQWFELKAYANKNDVQIVGDVPIFVAKLSVETWSNPELFKTDAYGKMSFISGYPPDDDGKNGQVWGNPVYDWKKMEENDFNFQINRIQFLLKQNDWLRLDHFIGYYHYWEIPNNGEAKDGRWVEAKGRELFDALKLKNSEIPIIVEDLGAITPEIEALRDDNNFPGMRNFLFAFEFNDGRLNTKNAFLPNNYTEQCVAYTATHDNEMLESWFESKNDFEKDAICKYMKSDREHIASNCMKAIFKSKAKFVIIPMQDYLHKTNECRMNTPGTLNDSNWTYKMENFDEFKLQIETIKELNIESNR